MYIDFNLIVFLSDYSSNRTSVTFEISSVNASAIYFCFYKQPNDNPTNGKLKWVINFVENRKKTDFTKYLLFVWVVVFALKMRFGENFAELKNINWDFWMP